MGRLFYKGIFFLCSSRQKEEGRYFVSRNFLLPLSHSLPLGKEERLGLEVLTGATSHFSCKLRYSSSHYIIQPCDPFESKPSLSLFCHYKWWKGLCLQLQFLYILFFFLSHPSFLTFFYKLPLSFYTRSDRSLKGHQRPPNCHS